MNNLLFAKNKREFPRERTYVIEGRFSEYTTDDQGITVELSKDGSEFLPITRATWTATDTKKVLRDAFTAEPSLLKLGRDALADRFKEQGVTPAIARAVKNEYLVTAGELSGDHQAIPPKTGPRDS